MLTRHFLLPSQTDPVQIKLNSGLIFKLNYNLFIYRQFKVICACKILHVVPEGSHDTCIEAH